MIRTSKIINDYFSDPTKTVLMKESFLLLALKYYKIDSLLLLHSIYYKKDSKSHLSYIATPVIVHNIEQKAHHTELTIKSLKDQYDNEVISLTRDLPNDQIDVYFSNIDSEYLSPKIHGKDWDNWSFSVSGSKQENIEKRKKLSIRKSNQVYDLLSQYDFKYKKILFLGSGDGEEILEFCKKFDLTNTKIFAVEQSNLGINNSKIILKDYNINFENQNFFNFLDNCKIKFDYIFTFGIFDRETLSETEGITLLEKIKPLLKGYLINSSYFFELFDSSFYKSSNFTVISSNLSNKALTNEHFFCYINKFE